MYPIQHLNVVSGVFLNQDIFSDQHVSQLDSLIEKFPYCQALYLLKMCKAKTKEEIAQLALHTPLPLYTFNIAMDINQNVFNQQDWFDRPSPKATITDTSDISITQNGAISQTSPAKDDTQHIEKTTITPVSPTLDTVKKDISGTGHIIKEKSTPVPSIEKKKEEGLQTFLDWLRSMNTISTAEKDAQMATIVVDESVIKNSINSINAQEVTTESMAEVWLKQDQPHQAIEVYKKLSLLFPHKSAYFARKMDSILKTLTN